MSNWRDDYEMMLLKATSYSGISKPGAKRISASSLTSDTLALYLDYKNGKTDDTKFEASNLGSMYQLGVDKACEGNLQYKSALRMEYLLPNGWTLSGEIDQLDLINKVIIDNKVSTTTAKQKIKKEGLNHQYAIQLAVYKFLYFKHSGSHFSGALAFVDKSASYFKPKSGETMSYMDIETYDYDWVVERAIERTNEVQKYIDMDMEPEICSNRFPFKTGGRIKPMKCLHYCSYSKFCKHAPQNNEWNPNGDPALDKQEAELNLGINDINPYDVSKFNF